MIRALLLSLLFCSASFGQSLSITAENVERTYTVSVVRIDAPSSGQFSISVSDVQRQPIPFLKLDKNSFEIRGTGKAWVRVTCIDFDSKFFDEQTIVVDLEGAPDDFDDDDFVPPDIDPAPAEYDGPNELGLGKVAFDAAPKHDATVVGIYKAAGEFLYGRPTVKVIAVQDSDRRDGTDFVLPVWIKNQMETKSEWAEWYQAVMRKAFELNAAGQIKTIADWHAAFNEIAAGVEARK